MRFSLPIAELMRFGIHIHSRRTSGIPWPGRTQARARRGPGAYWSGR